MPLPPELDQKIRDRFDELIGEATQLIQELEAAHAKSRPTTNLEIISTFLEAENPYISDCQALVVKAVNLVNMVFGNSKRGQDLVEDLKNHTGVKKGKVFILNYIVGTLQGLKDDYEHGFLENLANAFNNLKAQQLRGWAQVRNSGAHGKFGEFSRDDVDLMVKGVRSFLADYL